MRTVRWGEAAVLLLAAALVLGLLGLSAWQWQRLGWKQALMARTTAAATAAPVPAPGPAEWAALRPEADAYRRVLLQGQLDHSREQLVLASTELGRGHWVMTPLRTPTGHWVWVNRGFVDAAHRAPEQRPPADGGGFVALEGLLRFSEPPVLPWVPHAPGLGWAARELPALSAAAGLRGAAPWFLDLSAAPGPNGAHTAEAARTADMAAGAWPRPGLTVLRFSNNHLVYALTWLALAAMVAGATAYWWWRLRPQGGPGGGASPAARAQHLRGLA